MREKIKTDLKAMLLNNGGTAMTENYS